VPSHDPIELLRRLYDSAVAAADPLKVLPRFLPTPPRGRTVVVGVGKATASMARALEAHWQGGELSGVIAVPPGATQPLKWIEQVEGSHPVPSERSVEAGRRLMDAVSGLTADDLVIALISGGGSALCALPGQGITLLEKQAITRALLLSGASIHEMNTVRKHLSAIKGGRLARRASPAKVVSLLISDIPGDDPQLIASAPTLADPSSCAYALTILDKYRVAISATLREKLVSGALESPKPQPGVVEEWHIIARAQDGLDAAAIHAKALGWTPFILSDAMEGEARELARSHAAIAAQIRRRGQPFAAPCVILSGGEATVTVKGSGRGGRNTEFALALAMSLNGEEGVFGLSAGTDGLDGNGNAAGAWVAPDTMERARLAGRCASVDLDNNDSFTYFDAIGSTIVTGPTYTNINDFRAIAVLPRQDLKGTGS